MTITHTRTHTFTGTTLVRPLVRALLEDAVDKPWQREWSLQGFGMLRTYLDEEKNLRLHIWDPAFQVEDVDTVHTHPWNFHSFVVAGEVSNTRYTRRNELGAGDLPRFREQEILCGPGGCETDTSPKIVGLKAGRPEVYKQGDQYSQLAHEIHISEPKAGTVTIIAREFLHDTEHAYVYIPSGQEWVSAEPRPATHDEVIAICGDALKAWF